MPGASPGSSTLYVNAQPLIFQRGDTIAACLLRAGILRLRRSRSGEWRGLYCGIGICNECLVVVEGTPNIRACVTLAEAEMHITTEHTSE